MKLSRLENDKIPDRELNKLQLSMRHQVELKVENGTYQLEEITCPICEQEKCEIIGEKDRYGLYYRTNICISCGMVYTSPRMNQAAFNDFYNIEYRKLYVGTETPTEVFFNRQKAKAKHIYRFLLNNNLISEKPLYVLEVGCGAGGILDYFRDKEHKVKGIDLGEEYIDYGKEHYGLDLKTGTLNEVSRDNKPDLVIYSHVLEHILDVNAEVELIREFAHENTIVYIEVPGLKNIHNQFQSNILRYFQNAHTFHFSLDSLVNLMSKYGFELIHGTQYVRAAFQLSNKKRQPTSDYDSAIRYIEKVEKNRPAYPFTIRGMKRNMTLAVLWLLDATRTRVFARRIKAFFLPS